MNWYTVTFGPPPGPAPVTMSGRPLPWTSPAATRTPPVKFGSKAKKLSRNISSAAKTLTSGPPPASAAVTNTLLGSGVQLLGGGGDAGELICTVTGVEALPAKAA